MARWQGRLADSAYEEMMYGEMEQAEAWAATEAETTPNFGGYHHTLYSESGTAGAHQWAFWVSYLATGHQEERELTPQWDFRRLDDRHAPSVRVRCTHLSFADQMYLQFADDLKSDPESGALVVQSTGTPLAFFLRDRGPKLKHLMAPYVRPLIIIGEETDGREVLAQLCVHAVRSKTFDSKQELLDQLARWIGEKTGMADADTVTEAATLLVRQWVRPQSSRSFESFCRRTVAGLLKDRRRIEIGQQLVAGRLAGRLAERRSGRDGEDSISAIAMRAGVPRSTAYRWVREAKIPSGIADENRVYETTLGLRLTSRRRRYRPDEATERAADNNRRERENHRALIRILADQRGITERAARAWIRRRLDKDYTLEKIAHEGLKMDPTGLDLRPRRSE